MQYNVGGESYGWWTVIKLINTGLLWHKMKGKKEDVACVQSMVVYVGEWRYNIS